jgi:hypothetical protein
MDGAAGGEGPAAPAVLDARARHTSRAFDFIEIDGANCDDPQCTVPSVNGRHRGIHMFPPVPSRLRQRKGEVSAPRAARPTKRGQLRRDAVRAALADLGGELNAAPPPPPEPRDEGRLDAADERTRELRAALKARGLSTDGAKSELVRRLLGVIAPPLAESDVARACEPDVDGLTGGMGEMSVARAQSTPDRAPTAKLANSPPSSRATRCVICLDTGDGTWLMPCCRAPIHRRCLATNMAMDGSTVGGQPSRDLGRSIPIALQTARLCPAGCRASVTSTRILLNPQDGDGMRELEFEGKMNR